MFDKATLCVAGAGLVAVVAGGLTWRRFHPLSFWLCVGFPARAVWLYATWQHVASACKLTHKRRRWRVTLDSVPVLGAASREATAIVERRHLRRVEIEKAPRLGLIRPSRLGWRLPITLNDGQIPDDFAKVAERLAHAWRAHAVRVLDSKPGKVVLIATRKDPLVTVPPVEPTPNDLLTVRPGVLENGRPWLIDFKTVPHWLFAGATQSGKSTLLNAIIRGLAPQPVALVGFDLKGGVELTPYAARMSALATTRAGCVRLLDGLVSELTHRMADCREHGVRNVWRLPKHLRPMPIVVVVDEVAELFLIADKAEKDTVAKTSVALLRIAQLGRAFGVYLIVCGQRIGSDLGPGVTALRSQLSGRVCHRVNDPETATMTLGDMDPAALEAARAIPAETPGVAIVAGSDGSWHRARSALTTEADAEDAAHAHRHLATPWTDLVRTGPRAIPDDQAA
ncbi:FtsK/SpoIIIE domain-containing protein [Actinoallomurus rhizosphaericola]|uniref:FtsK/SpoIIIE domain-containing protein n=1 Tax=Actinoallomurus rhizosphaericola TaxID=2952536 RepID=UPI0020908652|nr:FtsK/SpoIIIE domain-containing protein [Actinoallomurus rhizosphaericola]MCO5992999.1 FtsK/SpoIIIE domain-containing protein [Actinoallomurus rhizosphaericola]